MPQIKVLYIHWCRAIDFEYVQQTEGIFVYKYLRNILYFINNIEYKVLHAGPYIGFSRLQNNVVSKEPHPKVLDLCCHFN